MADVVGVPTDYGIVKFEVREPGGGVGVAGRRDETLQLVRESYEQGLDGVRHVAERTIERLRSLSVRPDRVTLELGVKVSAQAGVFVANTAADANVKLILEWEREPRERAARGGTAEDG